MKRFFLRVLGELASPSPRLKRAWPFLVFVIVLVAVFSRPFFASALDGYVDNEETQGTLDKILGLLAGLVTTMASVVGNLIVLLIGYVLIPVMTYNEFSTSPVVGMGWSVIRDAVNMFFVLVLIVIAFGTILGYDKFKWRQHVPRLLITAVVINFSRTLCGLAIDLSQVVMLTFVNAIKDIAGGNFLQMFGVRSMLEADKASELLTSTSGISGSDIFIASVTSLIMLLIVLITLIFLMIILAYRVVVLWALVTVAPLAWFTKTLGGFTQGGDKGYTSWWKKFICALQVGPVLVFFLWLALAVAGSGSIGDSGFVQSTVDEASALKNPTLLQALGRTQLVSFVIGILLLFVGFDAANDACAGGDSVVSGLIGKAKSFSKPVVTAPVLATKFAAKQGLKGTKWVGKQGLKGTKWVGKKGLNTAWGGFSGGGGIKGHILGSKEMTEAAQEIGRAPILRHIGGGKLAEIVGKNRLDSKSKREKFDQTRATTMAKAGGFGDKSEVELQNLLKNDDKFTRLAAIQAMQDKGFFKDDPKLDAAQRAARLDNIRAAREQLKNNPEALKVFDDKLIKQSSAFALDTIYTSGPPGARTVDGAKLKKDLDNLRMGGGQLLSGLTDENRDRVLTAMGVNGDERLKYLSGLYDGDMGNLQKDLGRVGNDSTRAMIFDGATAAGIKGMSMKKNASGFTVDDYNKRDAILSTITKSGGRVGELSQYYEGPFGHLSDDAQEAMAKFHGGNAEQISKQINTDLGSGNGAVISAAKAQLQEIFDKIGDSISVEALEKFGKAGKNVRKALGEAASNSFKIQASALAPGATGLTDRIKDSLERAVKSGVSLDFTTGVFTGVSTNIQEAIKKKIGSMKAQDLEKIKFDDGSKTAVGEMMWKNMTPAVAAKIFEGNNRALQEAIRSQAALGATVNAAAHAKLKSLNFV